jgi:Zn-dependent protease with chaperone function
MKSVRCASSSRIRDVYIVSDNLMLLAAFLTVLLYDPLASWISTPITLLLVSLVTEIFSRYRMARLGAVPISEDQAPALMIMLHDESGTMAIKKFASAARSTVYCVPTAAEATAFTLGGFGPKLVVTGRLCVAASGSPEETRLILRHELAHIDNHDLWLWQLLLSGIVTAISSLLFSAELGAFGADLGAFTGTAGFVVALAGLPIGFVFLLLCFRRREFLADAIAMNHTEDRSRYVRLLNSAQKHKKSWFHPSPADRVAAIQSDSPVLRTNLVLLLIILWTAMGTLGTARTIAMKNESRLGIVCTILVGGLMFLAALVFELVKGPGRKIPLTHTETLMRPQPRAGYLSSLAVTFGVGRARLEPLRMVALLAATGMSEVAWIIDYRIRNNASWSYSGASLEKIIISSLASSLGSSCLLLIFLRYTRNLTEVGIGVSLVEFLYTFSWGTLEDLRKDVANIGCSVITFWCTAIGIICLGVVVARFRGVFVGLLLGDLCRRVLLVKLNLVLCDSNLGDLTWWVWPMLSSVLFASTFALLVRVFGGKSPPVESSIV